MSENGQGHVAGGELTTSGGEGAVQDRDAGADEPGAAAPIGAAQKLARDGGARG
jgi:hypothetical protein